MKKEKITFEDYFSKTYGERWPELKAALLNSSDQIIRPCFGHKKIKTNKEIFGLPHYSKDLYEKVNELNEEGLKQHYVMDPASLICANVLDIKPADLVLDMCAAPGGKTLILLEKIESGELWSNEISAARREKLKRVIQEHVPKERREKIFIKGKDGNRYGLIHPETFDKILVDAPCSGEKHLLETPKELAKWSPKRTKRLSTGQYSLLCSAILACKSEGQIVYSTCSISPLENDEVIRKALDKKSDSIKLNLPQLNIDGIEKTEFGYIFLPDQAAAGPIYFSRLVKK